MRKSFDCVHGFCISNASLSNWSVFVGPGGSVGVLIELNVDCTSARSGSIFCHSSWAQPGAFTPPPKKPFVSNWFVPE